MGHYFKSTLSTYRISDRPRGLPEHFPEVLRLEATVAINEAFGEFPSDHLVLMRCICIFSKLTKPIVAAVRRKQITAEAILTAMDDLLWHLLPYEDSQDLADMVRTCAGWWCEIPSRLLKRRESVETAQTFDTASPSGDAEQNEVVGAPKLRQEIPGQWNELLRRSSLSQAEAAKYLECSSRTVRRRVDQHELDKSKVGRIICNEKLRNQIRRVHGDQVLR